MRAYRNGGSSSGMRCGHCMHNESLQLTAQNALVFQLPKVRHAAAVKKARGCRLDNLDDVIAVCGQLGQRCNSIDFDFEIGAAVNGGEQRFDDLAGCDEGACFVGNEHGTTGLVNIYIYIYIFERWISGTQKSPVEKRYGK